MSLTSLLVQVGAPVVASEHDNQTQEKPALSTPQQQEFERMFKEGIQTYRQGDYAAALNKFQMGKEKAQFLGDRLWMARFLNGMGIIYFKKADYDQALDYYNRTQTLWEALDNKIEIAVSLNNIGTVYSNLNQFDNALKYHLRALGFAQSSNDTQSIADSFNKIGSIYIELGRFDNSLDYLSRALALRQPAGKPQDIAMSLHCIGLAYYRLGLYDKAVDYYSRALALREAAADKHDIAASLNALGMVYSDLGQFDKALECYSRALTLYQSFDSKQYIALCLNNIGMTYQAAGQNDKAQDYYTQALALYKEIGKETYSAHTVNNLGMLYTIASRYDKALEYYEHALALYDATDNKLYVAISLNNMGIVYQKQGNLGKAEEAFAHALQLYEDLSRQVGDPADIGAFEQTTLNLYIDYAALLVKRNRPADALALLERGRGVGLDRNAALLRYDLSGHFTKQEADDLKNATSERDAANTRLRAAQQSAVQALPGEKANAEKQLAVCRERREEAERKYTLVRDALFARYPQYRMAQGQKPPVPAALLSLANRHPDTLYLEWVPRDAKSTLLFALSKQNGVKALELPIGEKTLAKSVMAWRKALLKPGGQETNSPEGASVPSDQEAKQAHALYTALFTPLEKAGILSTKPMSATQTHFSHLVIVADGPLGNVPFAALLDGKGQRLVERYALSSAIGLGVLLWPANPRVPNHTLLCVADPFGTDGRRLVSASRGNEFGALKYARQEGQTVVNLFPGALGLFGPLARKGEVRQAMGEYAVLHFATHGYLDEKIALRSGLIFAPEPANSAEDGVLEAREIAGIPLSARLAVLSACDTARGQTAGGEGLLGLAWAFRAAGCPSVLASQWQVNDATTGRLITAFYRELKAGKQKDEALRKAMLSVKKDARFIAPFYWAAFQVIGETDSLTLTDASKRGKK